jgi:hypothetical protein
MADSGSFDSLLSDDEIFYRMTTLEEDSILGQLKDQLCLTLSTSDEVIGYSKYSLFLGMSVDDRLMSIIIGHHPDPVLYLIG